MAKYLAILWFLFSHTTKVHLLGIYQVRYDGLLMFRICKLKLYYVSLPRMVYHCFYVKHYKNCSCTSEDNLNAHFGEKGVNSVIPRKLFFLKRCYSCFLIMNSLFLASSTSIRFVVSCWVNSAVCSVNYLINEFVLSL